MRTANALLAYASIARQLAIVYRHCQPARGSRFPGLAPFLFLSPLPHSTILHPVSPSPSLVTSRNPLDAHSCLYLPHIGRRPRWKGDAGFNLGSILPSSLASTRSFLFLSLAIRDPDMRCRIVREDSNLANAAAFKAWFMLEGIVRELVTLQSNISQISVNMYILRSKLVISSLVIFNPPAADVGLLDSFNCTEKE